MLKHLGFQTVVFYSCITSCRICSSGSANFPALPGGRMRSVSRTFLGATLLALASGRAAFSQLDLPVANKDPQAVSVLATMMEQTGWSSKPKDITLHGTIASGTGISASSTGAPITMRFKGRTKARFDYDNSSSGLIWNGMSASTVTTGAKTSMPKSVVQSMQIPVLPVYSEVNSFDFQGVQLTYKGITTFEGHNVHEIEYLHKRPLWANKSTPEHRMTLYIDTSTYFPVGMKTGIPSAVDSKHSAPVDVVWTSYQTVNGFAYPGHVEERIYNNVFLSVNVSAASSNDGIGDEMFSLQ